ncbi:MAG: GNAT family N-acetyltransferase [Lachnospiraceae bacterium]|nr:GNAT family N-acetyltransferase [Lachnospiraceae bacterium]
METERLILRNFMEDDCISCFRNFGKDKSIGQFIPLFPMLHLDEMERLIKTLIPNLNAWLIIEKDTGQPVGYVTMDIPYHQLKIGEIGYLIGERFQRKGFAGEAIAIVLYEYFMNKDLYMIEAKYMECNDGSANLLRNLGFREDGRLRERRIDFQSGDRKDLIVCSITKQEFLAGK